MTHNKQQQHLQRQPLPCLSTPALGTEGYGWLLQRCSCSPESPGLGDVHKSRRKGTSCSSLSLTVGCRELQQRRQRELLALGLEKEQLRRSDSKSKGKKRAAETQQQLVRWRSWCSVPHRWLSVALPCGQALCAFSGSVALNRGTSTGTAAARFCLWLKADIPPGWRCLLGPAPWSSDVWLCWLPLT